MEEVQGIFQELGDVRGSLNDFEQVIRSLGSLKRFNTQTSRELKAVNREIKLLERRGADVTLLKQTAAELKTLADLIKVEAAKRPVDVNEVSDKMNKFFEIKGDLMEATQVLGGEGSGEDEEFKEFKKFMPKFESFDLFRQ